MHQDQDDHRAAAREQAMSEDDRGNHRGDKRFNIYGEHGKPTGGTPAAGGKPVPPADDPNHPARPRRGRPPKHDRPDPADRPPAIPRPDLFELSDDEYAGLSLTPRRDYASMSKAQQPMVDKLEWARVRRGVERPDLERACGMDAGTWSKALGDNRRPILPERLMRAAIVLGVAPEFLAHEGDWAEYPEGERLLAGPAAGAAPGARDRILGALAAQGVEGDAEAERVIELGVMARELGLGAVDMMRLARMIGEAGGLAGLQEAVKAARARGGR